MSMVRGDYVLYLKGVTPHSRHSVGIVYRIGMHFFFVSSQFDLYQTGLHLTTLCLRLFCYHRSLQNGYF